MPVTRVYGMLGEPITPTIINSKNLSLVTQISSNLCPVKKEQQQKQNKTFYGLRLSAPAAAQQHPRVLLIVG